MSFIKWTFKWLVLAPLLVLGVLTVASYFVGVVQVDSSKIPTINYADGNSTGSPQTWQGIAEEMQFHSEGMATYQTQRDLWLTMGAEIKSWQVADLQTSKVETYRYQQEETESEVDQTSGDTEVDIKGLLEFTGYIPLNKKVWVDLKISVSAPNIPEVLHPIKIEEGEGVFIQLFARHSQIVPKANSEVVRWIQMSPPSLSGSTKDIVECHRTVVSQGEWTDPLILTIPDKLYDTRNWRYGFDIDSKSPGSNWEYLIAGKKYIVLEGEYISIEFNVNEMLTTQGISLRLHLLDGGATEVPVNVNLYRERRMS